MIKFDILGEREKKSFTDVLDWQLSYKTLKCGKHQKKAILNLLIDKSGSNVSVAACCEEFFLTIVEKKNRTAKKEKSEVGRQRRAKKIKNHLQCLGEY